MNPYDYYRPKSEYTELEEDESMYDIKLHYVN